MTHCKTVAVCPPPDDPNVARLLRSLAAAFDVSFAPVASLDQSRHDAVLLLADDNASLLRAHHAAPAVFSAPGLAGNRGETSGAVLLSDSPELPPVLRGQSLACALDLAMVEISLSGFTTLATIAGRPYWSLRAEAGVLLQVRSSLPIAGLPERDDLIDVLHEQAFAWLLPLFDFLRRITAGDAWQRPPLRATLIFDDPNLHSGRYGLIDYRDLALRGRRLGFHSCMATIPLDGWMVSRRSSALFREYQDVLSLAVHGNDHEYKELARPVPAAEADRVIAQATNRIASIERRSGLAIARVMIPPHGACSAHFLDAMARAGFSGATTTRGAIWENNDTRHRRAGSAVALAEIVHGLPIVHRFRFNRGPWQHRVTIAAYLGQPLVPYGHHDDFAGNPAAFDAVAARINELGAKWLNPAELFASNYETKRRGRTTHLRPFSRQITVSADHDCMELSLDLTRFSDRPVGQVIVTESGTAGARSVPADAAGSIPVLAGRQVTLHLVSGGVNGSPTSVARRTRLSSALRRVATEFRDRCAPLHR